MTFDDEDKCPTCGGDKEKVEYFVDGKNVYYKCGHRKIVRGINEVVQVSDSVNAYVKKDLNTLYEELARLQPPGKQYLQAGVVDYIKKGRERFDDIIDILRIKICDELKVCEHVQKFSDIPIVTLVTLLFPFLTQDYLKEYAQWVSLGLIISIIAKISLVKLCNC